MKTKLGIEIQVFEEILDYDSGIFFIYEELDKKLGAIFKSSFEVPDRYTCWDVGFINPPLMIKSKPNKLIICALNQRGEQVVSILSLLLPNFAGSFNCDVQLPSEIICTVRPSEATFSEENRSKQPSIFSIIRALIQCFYNENESSLGLYGAFGYDLIFQFEKLQKQHERTEDQEDMILFLPDEIYLVDHRLQKASCKRYDFSYQQFSTKSYLRHGKSYQPATTTKPSKPGDHLNDEFVQTVMKAKVKFKKGELFEVVPSQVFHETCKEKASTLFQRLSAVNPAPYGFFVNLGKEYLIGASPEMYVRVQGKRIETSPISGTIKRGKNPIEDASQIATLLNSEKECAELTMCTDVDRNDKSRICEAGSVNVIGRRQIEIYSRLIHTVDHVEGILREDYDAIDAFISHMWVVTVTGAPKLWAMQFIETHEKSPREWYAGAVGWFGFNGNLNTGLTLRTIQYKKGLAKVRAGATLLFDSDPESEEHETRLKGAALLDVIRGNKADSQQAYTVKQTGTHKKVLIIDHDDSFVHTLSNYFRQTGAEVVTYRYGFKWGDLDITQFDLIVLSPGPGRPEDFNLTYTLDTILEHNIPIFGVCLGHQAIINYFGGKLKQLETPVHGKTTEIINLSGKLLGELNKDIITVGRYHSLYADLDYFPFDNLEVTGTTADGIVMAIEHKSLPVFGVQFHPETILSLYHNVGFEIITRIMNLI